MTDASDPIAVLEAAYTIGGTEREWLARLVRAARTSVDDGHGLSGWTYDASGDLHQVRENATLGIDPTRLAQSAKFDASLPDPIRRMVTKIYRSGFVGNLANAPAAFVRQGMEREQAAFFGRALEGFLREWKADDMLWVNAQDPTYFGCLLAAPLRRRGALPPRQLHQLHCVAAHMVTAFRVRRQFTGWPTGDGDGPLPEAILAVDGSVAHAEEPAKNESARAALRHAVLSVSRARGKLRRHDPTEAVAIWHALVAGRWSLVEHVDSDGRKFLLAHRNDPRVPDQRGLTLRERQVLAYAILGHSNKVIAYELGLSLSTVARQLSRARQKTRLARGALAIAEHGAERSEVES